MTAGMRGKVCLVTGANAGIGKAAALGLARQGATVVLLCRSEPRGHEALEEIERRSGNGSLALLVADLASRRRVRAAADEYLQRFERLDVLVNNAGVLAGQRASSERGRAGSDVCGESPGAVSAHQSAARSPQGLRPGAHRHGRIQRAPANPARLRQSAARARLFSLGCLLPVETGECVLHL
ncbi:Dehydrogenase/reductase SDR family member 13 [Geodia barretti]|uniref:Dehydrogenase/reductase SDR family member 13 n=1 Tax=Geodia barretti TaxID=519541 RepID=A0AA35R0T6_GEOBA|nr:Dehydrogenase/reductase SDR family member 13 [Geodia barretti]